MRKAELINSISEKGGLSKTDAGKALKAFTDTVMEGVVSGDKVAIHGFGTFEQTKRSARQARNPRTGEPVMVAATKVPRFMPASAFRAAVKGEAEE